MKTANKIDISDLLDIETQEQSSMFRTTKQEVYSHQVFLDEDIGPPSKYRDLINILYMAGEHDQINILINSCGGYMSTAIAIIEAIKASDAMVRAIIVGECHSAASIIAMNCHEIVVTDSAYSMVHTANYGAGGSTQNVKSHTDFSTKFINSIIDQTYKGFMNDEEIVDLKKGVEFWFDCEQIRERLETRLEYLKNLPEPKEKKPKVKRKPKVAVEQ